MSAVTRRGCAGHESSSGKQNTQLPPAPPHQELCSGPVFPPRTWDLQNQSDCVASTGYAAEGTLGLQGRAGGPSCISPECSPAKSIQLPAGWGLCVQEAFPPCQASQEHKQNGSSCVGGCRDRAGEEEPSFRDTRRYRGEKAVVKVKKRKKGQLSWSAGFLRICLQNIQWSYLKFGMLAGMMKPSNPVTQISLFFVLIFKLVHHFIGNNSKSSAASLETSWSSMHNQASSQHQCHVPAGNSLAECSSFI